MRHWGTRPHGIVISPYRILERKRAGGSLRDAEVRAVVAGAADGSWTDGQLAAFLMAAAIRGLDAEETQSLTLAMLESGEQWDLAADYPTLTDKHSTGGVGDKVSLVLAPLLAACDVPVAMLTGRALGHTGGTADKLEVVPGLDLRLDRARCLDLLEDVGMAIGIATSAIAPADGRLYQLRDQTATVSSLPLITASILSKKLATGAAALVFDVKTGNGAILADKSESKALAELLVETCVSLGRRAGALITDMSQPLGRWVGHAAELKETLECLAGDGPDDLMEVVYALALELGALLQVGLDTIQLDAAISSGLARERFERWAVLQGGDREWLAAPDLSLGKHEYALEAQVGGVLSRVETKTVGRLLGEAAVSSSGPSRQVDPAVALHYGVRLGDRVGAGEDIGRLYLRRADERLADELRRCFVVDEEGISPPLIVERLAAG
ncbi:MAG: thymidine phosphorylase [Acidobacteria bacterium]|nr:MAG: thymidine phosphorylase [Acidobacteriota bacterium]